MFLTGAPGGAVDKVYAAATAMDRMNLPYSTGYRTLAQQPPPQGYDCSASVSWALLAAGLPLPSGASWGSWAPVSGDFEGWGQSGVGQRMTVWCNSGHIFIEFYGYPAKRFDTVPGNSGGIGPHLRYRSGQPGRHLGGLRLHCPHMAGRLGVPLHDISDQVLQDSDVLYTAIYEWHGAMSLEDVAAFGRQWEPLDRAAVALQHLLDYGFAQLRDYRTRDGRIRRFVHLVSPASLDA